MPATIFMTMAPPRFRPRGIGLQLGTTVATTADERICSDLIRIDAMAMFTTQVGHRS